MKIGEYFIEKNYITQKTLDEALELQKHLSSQPIGEILVNMGEISRENLTKYVIDYINVKGEDTGKMLTQNEIDSLFQKDTSPLGKR